MYIQQFLHRTLIKFYRRMVQFIFICKECGDANETKFKVVRDFIAKYLLLSALPTPSSSPKSLYGTIQFVSYAIQLKYFTNLVESLFLPCMQDRDVILLDGVRKIR